MEQRITYTLGFDLPNPVGRVSNGGCFGIESNVPSTLRGPVEGFVAAVLFRPRISLHYNNFTTFNQFLVGCFDFLNLEGWAFTIAAGYILTASIGTESMIAEVKPEEDTLALLTFDGTTAFLYVNGVQVGSVTPLLYATGPDNFGIGGSTEASLNAFGASFLGANSVGIGGFMMASPSFVAANAEEFTNSPPVDQFAAAFSALDVVDVPPSDIPQASPEFPQADYLWSTRRGLPQLVDNGNEVWADQVAGLELQRIGLQTGASVEAKYPNWGDYDFVPTPPPS